MHRNHREPIITDFGNYLRTLRIEKGFSIKAVAEGLALSPNTVQNYERGYNSPPNEAKLRLWLRVLGAADRLPEALQLLRQIRSGRRFAYIPRNSANEHIDRILDCYENGTLSDADLALLKMVAPHAYD